MSFFRFTFLAFCLFFSFGFSGFEKIEPYCLMYVSGNFQNQGENSFYKTIQINHNETFVRDNYFLKSNHYILLENVCTDRSSTSMK